MKCLVVSAHPLPNSLCHALSQYAIASLQAAGHSVEVENLYAQEFSAVLTAQERGSYYAPTYDAQAVQAQVQRLQAAQVLVLCFPTWWFGFPAILKGWFDRVWGPGIAYDHAVDLGAIKPRLLQLRHVLVVTSLGSPRWVDWLVMRQPVKRILKTAILGACAPQARFDMLSVYQSEKISSERFAQIKKKLLTGLSNIR